jgi:hypothetical protein
MGKGFSAIDFIKRSIEFEQQKVQDQKKPVQTEKMDSAHDKKQETNVVKTTPKENIQQKDILFKIDDLKINSSFYKMPNSVEDRIMPSLSTSEEIVYRRLIRLSWGWSKNYCRAGLKYLQDVSGIKSRTTVKEALDSLIEKKLIYHCTEDGHTDRNQQGTLYIIPIPDTPNEEISEAGEEKLLDDSNFKKLSLSEIASNFYKGIGQTKISKNKKEKAEKDIDELLNDNFSVEDVEFAVEWTLKNSTEKIYDFSIIKHTIGQATAEKRKIEEQKARKLNEEKMVSKKLEEENKRNDEFAKIKAYKEAMTKKDRDDLHKKAEFEIRNCGKYREEFITDLLIETKENELIGKELGIELPQ